MASRSASLGSFDVAWRSRASGNSSPSCPRVVGHAHESRAAVAQIHRDGGGAGVERVLHQLLGGRRRALDDLAGSDLVTR